MKALLTVDSLNFSSGGTALSVSRLADALCAMGCGTTLIANDYASLGSLIKPDKAQLHVIPARRLPFRMGAWNPGFRQRALAEARHADLIHTHGLWLSTNHTSAKAAHHWQKPFLVSPRGMLEPWTLRHRALRKQLVWHLSELAMLRSAAGFHATSANEAESIRRTGLTQPIAVIPNGVDTALDAPSREEIDTLLPPLRGKKWLLFLSRLHKKKGLDVLLESWAQLYAQFPDWHLVIAGDDMDGGRSDFERQAGRLDIQLHTTFTGEVSGSIKQALLARAMVFVLPSHSENFGNVIAESLAAGTPVITTRGTPWQELTTQKCGWWIECTRESLTSTMEEAMRSPSEELDAAGKRGRELVLKNYSWLSVAARMREYYCWICGISRDTPSFVIS